VKKTLDPIEAEYERAIDMANTDEAYELAIGLKQYRELYQIKDETHG